MADTTTVLLATAASIGFLHTVVGIDHSLPFVLIGRARGWSAAKLMRVTALCGLAHVLSSVLIGAIGLAIGVAIERLEWLENSRGRFAAWLLIGFGLAYTIFGLYRARRNRPHEHVHLHDDGTVHAHRHDHHDQHLHAHENARFAATTVAVLFVIFLLGPCEALIPLIMVPAAAHSWLVVVAVVAVFGAVTIATMMSMVLLGHYGLRLRGSALLERYMTALAGLAIALSGLAIQIFDI
jgi:nickel/cobalt exporter